MKISFRISIICLMLLVVPILSEGQDMTDYCQLPSSIEAPIDPNLLLVIDVSGSMGWKAYSYGDTDSNSDGYLDGYNATTTYEGYFDPAKYYELNASNVYVETPTGLPCVKECTKWKCQNYNLGDCVKGAQGCGKTKWACCTAWKSSGNCTLTSGNYLNYQKMTRIDVLRWTLTGGKLQSCVNSVETCDPEVYPNSKLSCDNNGCILLSSDGATKVKVPWARITGNSGGLLFQLKNLSPKPIIGAMFYDTNGVTRTVYIGDFTSSSPASYDVTHPYKNVITAINYEVPGGSTPTGPALWDAYNYFSQKSPQYGGPGPQTDVNTKWKNPMNRCFDANNDGTCQASEFEVIHCAKNFLLLLTDGQWNRGGRPVQSACKISDDIEAESPDPVVPAYWLHKKGFKNQITNIDGHVEAIYAIGLWLGGTGEQALKNVAMYGSFDRTNTWPGGTTGYPQDSCGPIDDCCSTANCGKGSACTDLPSSSPTWDKDGNGIPDTFFNSNNATQIKEKMVDIILDILRHVSSGSAVSILASGEGSGANLLQAVYFPRKSFGITEIEWVGKMHNLWYYVDPLLQNSNIREDTVEDKKLNLSNDYIVRFFYDSATSETLVERYSDTDGDGAPNESLGIGNFDDVKNLWEAGRVLWSRNLTTSPRNIYTQLNGNLTDFSIANASGLQSYLGVSTLTESQDIINYVHGIDKNGYRSRTVTIGGNTAVWKLGDIVNSTPRIQSFVPTNTYHLTPPSGYSDTTYHQFINQPSYASKGVVYVGANDGMLHAFYLGNLKQKWSGQGTDEKMLLDGSDHAKELWAFIPKNVLPYLKYLPDQDYCHLYSVDASSFLVDASINGDPNDNKTASSWKTILIGGMGLGGASRNVTGTNCIKTPANDLGYSSYFAIDVTDPNNPVLLWEFSDAELGMSTSGPAIVRQGDGSKNGNWFVVFASGPTGPINTNYRQFLGKSDQPLKLFVLDLKTGTLQRKINTGIQNAFGSSLYNATLDTDRGNRFSPGHYKDDVLYLGYTKCADSPCTAGSTWTKGGVLRLVTKESINPADWSVSTVIDDIGPVTAAVTKLQDRKNGQLWLYFGTGRYFYKLGTSFDDPGSQSDTTIRKLYGIQEPCYLASTNDIDQTCSLSVSDDNNTLQNQSGETPSASIDTGKIGWYIKLDAPASGYLQERVITDPLAVFSGVVFFTTYSPSGDVCEVGGKTYVWAVDYKSGANPSSLLGKALVQVSTGEISEVSLASAFKQKGGRRNIGITGVPPKGQGLSVLIGPRPLQKVLHIQEK